jgi:hypothetical protein
MGIKIYCFKTITVVAEYKVSTAFDLSNTGNMGRIVALGSTIMYAIFSSVCLSSVGKVLAMNRLLSKQTYKITKRWTVSQVNSGL